MKKFVILTLILITLTACSNEASEVMTEDISEGHIFSDFLSDQGGCESLSPTGEVIQWNSEEDFINNKRSLEVIALVAPEPLQQISMLSALSTKVTEGIHTNYICNIEESEEIIVGALDNNNNVVTMEWKDGALVQN